MAGLLDWGNIGNDIGGGMSTISNANSALDWGNIGSSISPMSSMSSGVDWNNIGNSIGGGMSYGSGTAPTINQSGGLWNNIKGGVGSGLDWLTENKDMINTAGGLFGAYTNYQSMKNQQDYANRMLNLQENAYNRGIEREDAADSALASGFASSGLGLYDGTKKRNTDTGRNVVNSNYYSV